MQSNSANQTTKPQTKLAASLAFMLPLKENSL